jgi:putative RNA 2'-phosphotransferase
MLNKSEMPILSKTISHMLRHEPWLYELELDDEGWTSLSNLIDALRVMKHMWAELNENDISHLIEISSKKRHELSNGKIRALYGHSVPGQFKKEKASPPDHLYHGTSPKILEVISREGLKPMNRQFVHLTIDIEMAKEVGNRKSSKPIILKINSKAAAEEGINFYRATEQVWLADLVPGNFIELTFP